jgi:hypothetical protein
MAVVLVVVLCGGRGEWQLGEDEWEQQQQQQQKKFVKVGT